MRRKTRVLNRRGFTLVECIVAVALFAIISTLGISMFSNSTRYMSEAKRTQAKLSKATRLSESDSFKDKSLYPDEIVHSGGTGGKDVVFNHSVLIQNWDSEGNLHEYARITYKTRYGNASVVLPVDSTRYEKDNLGKNYKKYLVLTDGYKGKKKVGRDIYIHNS